MPTDLTGTPTSLGIGTYNVDADAPSGLGFNEAMGQIDALLQTMLKTPTGIATGEVPVWNGSAWARSSVTGMTPSGISGYPNDVTKVLRGDGSWGRSELVYAEKTSAVSIVGTTEAGSTLLIDSGATAYDGNPVVFESWGIIQFTSGFSVGDAVVLYLFDSGSSLGELAFVTADENAISTYKTFYVKRRFTPSAGSHDFGLRAAAPHAGDQQLLAGAGGAGTPMPAAIRITRAQG